LSFAITSLEIFLSLDRLLLLWKLGPSLGSSFSQERNLLSLLTDYEDYALHRIRKDDKNDANNQTDQEIVQALYSVPSSPQFEQRSTKTFSPHLRVAIT
jgi:hypothetical protein